MIIYYTIITNTFKKIIIGDTPKRKQFDTPDFVNTTLRRDIIQNYLVDYNESVINSLPSSVTSSELSLNESESNLNLPSKENSPQALKVIIL